MICVYRLSQVAIALGISIVYYGAFQNDLTLFITGIAVAWSGFGLMTTLLESQRNHQD